MIDISFIIPVYNGEKTIKRCLDSIRKCQKRIEILVIDDGSTDKTGEICEKLSIEDERIKIITIENSGQGIARNHGLNQSSGKYVCFVDADDFVFCENLEQMYECAKDMDVDVIMGAYVRKLGKSEIQIKLPGEGRINRYEAKQQIRLYHKVKTTSAFGYVWNKLYKRTFLVQNHLKMDDIRKVYMEDTMFNLKVWSKNPSWYCMNLPVYCYDIENESTTRKSEPQIHEKYIAMVEELISYLKKEGHLEENLDTVVPLIMRTFCWSLVKNVPYEGISFSRINMRMKSFMDNVMIQQTLRGKGAWKSLWKLPSKLQSVFFGICFVLLKLRLSYIVTGIFLFFYPIMKVYVSKSVK